MQLNLTLSLSLVISVFGSSSAWGQDGKQSLSIGSKAPSLAVEHWLTNGDGRFKSVTEFEPGQVYVVEFWATWCGPCIMSMPHLVEVQNCFADKQVQVISISDESLDTVLEFLQKPSPNAKDLEADTFQKLTKAYCLTTDPDGSSHRDYMLASGQQGIPASFIIGKTGYIEWIGHPIVIDEPLAKVVEGTWDREEYKKELAREMERTRILEEVSAKAGKLARDGKLSEGLELVKKVSSENEGDSDLVDKLQSLAFKLKTNGPFRKLGLGKVAEAKKELESVIRDATESQKNQIAITKCKILTNRFANNSSNELDCVDSLQELVDAKGVPVSDLLAVAFEVLYSLDDPKELPKSIVVAALKCSERVIDQEPDDLTAIETYCRFAVLNGEREAALRVIEKGMANADESKKQKLQRMLLEIKQTKD